MRNGLRSPTFEILRSSINLNLYDEIMNMTHRNHVMSKSNWRALVTKRAWQIEDIFWNHQIRIFRMNNYLVKLNGNPRYLTWWFMSDIWPNKMRMCDDMARIVCRVSKLKSDDPEYKRLPFGSRSCKLCEGFAEENIVHLTMQCPFFEDVRKISLIG